MNFVDIMRTQHPDIISSYPHKMMHKKRLEINKSFEIVRKIKNPEKKQQINFQ